MHTANRASTEPFPAFSGFRYRPALPYQAGVSRRDPSPVPRAGGRNYVWYSRSTHDASGYWATIWYATSTDGLHWVEHGQVLGRGPRGAFDEHAVFTPTVMVAEDCYWLFLRIIDEQADRLTRLIGDLLDVGRLETGTLAVTPSPARPTAAKREVGPERFGG